MSDRPGYLRQRRLLSTGRYPLDSVRRGLAAARQRFAFSKPYASFNYDPAVGCIETADKKHRAKLPGKQSNIALSGQMGQLINGSAPEARKKKLFEPSSMCVPV
jgi:hypothetical protein